MDIDAQTVIQAVRTYKTQIVEMDRKVQLFLSDRRQHRYPRYEEMITEIRRFENRIYNVNFGFANTEVHMRLDGLMHSLIVYEQTWKRMFNRDSENYEKKGVAAPVTISEERPPEPEESHPLVDKVFAYAQKKWAESGINGAESKQQLSERLLPEYKEARKKLKKGEKISVTYDTGSKQVKIAVKRSSLA